MNLFNKDGISFYIEFYLLSELFDDLKLCFDLLFWRLQVNCVGVLED